MLRLLRALVAGGAATAVDLAALALLVSLLHVDPRVANVPALAIGALTQFFANRRFVFATRGPLAPQAIRFVVVEAGALVLNGALYELAMRAAAASPAPWLYVALRLVTQNLVFLAFSYPLWHFVFAPVRAGERAV